MKKLIALFTICAALSVHAEKANYWWNGSWWAKSTSGIENIVVDGDQVTFTLLSNICIGDADGDCNTSATKPYPSLRNQLQSKYGEKNNRPVTHTFSVKKENMHGTSLRLWELKPFGMRTGTVPTLNIDSEWIGIKWANEHNEDHSYYQDYDLEPGVWDNFVIETLQTPFENGYVRVILNGKLVFDYDGPTSYSHHFPNQIWIGPYICCGYPEDEPNHVVSYKNITPKYVH